MLIKHETPHGSWSGRRSFVFAAACAVIGFANFWRFPYAMAENGGVWFLLTYAGFLLLFALPLLYGEMLLGRLGRCSPIGSMGLLVKDFSSSSRWRSIGVLGTVAGLLTLALYTVVAGMTLSYVFQSAFGDFSAALPAQVGLALSQMHSDPVQLLAWELLFVLGVLTILRRGVNRGIERASRYLMPLFLLILAGLLVYALMRGDLVAARAYLFGDANQSYTWQSPLYAAQHAFFTLGVGMGAMMAYGAYSPGRQSILPGILWVIGLDLLISLVAGLMIFPLVFAAGLGPAQGFDLMFLVIPLTFGQLPLGQLLAALFFVLMTLAAWGSAIALGEPLVAWLVERFRLSRQVACWLLLLLMAPLALGLTLSLGVSSEQHWFGVTWFGLYDLLVAGLLIPLTALLIALYCGWGVGSHGLREVVTERESLWFYRVWRILIRFVAPPLIVLLMIVSVVNFARTACEIAESNFCGIGLIERWTGRGAAPDAMSADDLVSDLEVMLEFEVEQEAAPATPVKKASEENNDQNH